MPAVESEQQAARLQLERILASSGFARNERMSRFLRFVVDRHLEGRDHELKESVIAIEVFGRRPDYNPKHDPIVRTEAGRLRARLSEYYSEEGKNDALVLELPKGGYIPRFRALEVSAPNGSGSESATKLRARAPVWLLASVASLAVALATLSWWWFQHEGAPVAIAVLPLNDLSRDPVDDYFADGLTGEIIRNLSLIDGLTVRSQTSSFVFKGQPRNVREVGKELAAEYILEGSVLRAEHLLRVNVQLVRVQDDFPLWSGRYDRELTDVFAIQDEISRGIVNSLRLKLGRGRRRYETSVEAYDLYLRGRALHIQRGGPVLKQSVGYFEQAIVKDASFAPAHAALAAAHAIRSGWFARDIAEDVVQMRAAAEKAIQLDPMLAEAHEALGIAYSRDAQWEQAEKSFRRAIELEPGRSTLYGQFARFFLLPLGRIEEALEQMRVAEKADPLSPEVHFYLGNVLISAGRYDEAASHCERILPNYAGSLECVAQAWIGQGRFDEVIRLLSSSDRNNSRGLLGYAYARTGRREEAEKLAAVVDPNIFNKAQIFAGLGDKDRTLEALDRAVVAGPSRIGTALTFPEFTLLRGDPRLKALRRKVGLPE
jgi:TolB-like protein/Flp pilus assembly protein TadD